MTTERELMEAGQPYLVRDAELVGLRARAHQLAYDFNHIPPREQARANKLLNDEIIDSPSKDAYIDGPLHVDYGKNIHVGKQFYANFNCTFLDEAPIRIGDHVLLAPNVGLYTASHPLDAGVRIDPIGMETSAPITIGNNTWIGANVVVCPGVTIGDNVVVGAGSVVSKDIPSDVIAVGNPARVLRKLTEKDHEYWQKQLELHNQRISGQVEFKA